jgi:hypothetical protein
MGKFLAILLVGSAVIGGVAMYYLQVYGFYRTLDPAQVTMAVTRADGVEETLPLRDAQAIDSDSSPIRYRACATVAGDLPDAAGLVPYPGAVPLTAPGWFSCFDAAAIGAALETGAAQAYLSQAHTPWGVDRVIALFPDGRAFVWPQINRCGAELFDGKPLPEGCPPPPPRGG